VTFARKRPLLAIALGLAVVSIGLALLAVTTQATTKAPQRVVAPELPTKVVQGRAVNLASLRGKPAVVNFWASWCEPCRKEAPQLQSVVGKLPHGATLVGVDYMDQATPAHAFIAEYGWTFPLLDDPDGTVGDAYGVSALPNTFILDSTGHVVHRLVGPQTKASIEAALNGVS
jgi:cytochrome c biogenesis protein CcmG/thiol:disulfide interchange protein DsbE